MLNKEAQDLQQAAVTFDISTSRSELQKVIRDCEFYTCQYLNNNTVYDLTVMDNFGFRQTLPRKTKRVGDRVFQIVREYRITHALESHARNFVDEIEIGDGKVLNALKDVVGNPDFFRHTGFGDEYKKNATSGYLFMLVLEINESQFKDHLSVGCEEAGLVISKLRREVMPANLVYAHSNKGSFNPFQKIVGKTFSMSRTMANYHHSIKERYWYILGDKVQEVEYVKNKNLEEGIHVIKYVKNLNDETTVVDTIKYLKFDDVSNKNGIFTSERDAMLSINIERTMREREADLAEREHQLRVEAHELKEKQHVMHLEQIVHDTRLNVAKRDLALVKQVGEELTHLNSTQIEELRHENTVEVEKLRQRGMRLDSDILRNKAHLVSITAISDETAHQRNVVVENMKHQVALVKHDTAMREMDRAEQLSEVTHIQKMRQSEVGFFVDEMIMDRKIREERTKTASSALGIGKTVLGYLGL